MPAEEVNPYTPLLRPVCAQSTAMIHPFLSIVPKVTSALVPIFEGFRQSARHDSRMDDSTKERAVCQRSHETNPQGSIRNHSPFLRSLC